MKVKYFESFIKESISPEDRVEFADDSDGLKVPRTAKVLEIEGKYAIVEFVLDGKKVKSDVLVSRLRKIEEGKDKDLKNYMFFGNLETIKRCVEKIMAMDKEKVDGILSDGHAWAVDHISTSKDDVEEVAGFLENTEEEQSQISPELRLAVTEYHQALRKQQKLQKKFINTPKENFNEKLELKNDLLACMRDVRAKEDQFRYLLKESGEEDLYENVNEDSAGKFTLQKDWEGKDSKGKTVKLKRGTVLKHERFGGWGDDFFVTGSTTIPGENIPQNILSAPY